jgi:uncharacterized protein YbjT (DUF2867 family)
MILVTGASGNVGGSVLRELLRIGAAVRGMYRSPREAAKAPAGAETAIADFADRPSLDRALQSIDRVFLVCSPIPQLVDLESNVIEACRDHGIRHLVQNSAFGAGRFDKSFPSWHFEVEKRVHASGIPATILRPETFMQNIPSFYAGTIASDRAFFVAGGEAPIAFVDVRDIAAVAATALTTEGHAGATYTLTGGEALSYGDVAERISRLLGTPVRYVAITPEQSRQAMSGLGMPTWQVEALLELQSFYTDGPGATVTGDVAKVLGQEPIRFDQFLNDYAASFAVQAATA